MHLCTSKSVTRPLREELKEYRGEISTLHFEVVRSRSEAGLHQGAALKGRAAAHSRCLIPSHAL